MSWSKLAVAGLTIVGLLIIWMTHQIWAAVFLGVLFALSLNGPAEWLRERVRMPAWLATLLVLLVVLATLAGLGWMIGSPLGGQVDDLTRKLPAATARVLTWLEQRSWGRGILQHAEDWSGMSRQEMQEAGDSLSPSSAQGLRTPQGEQPQADARVRQQENEQAKPQDETKSTGASGRPNFVPILESIAGALSLTVTTGALLMVTLVMTLFVAFDPDVYYHGVLWLVPKQHEAMARRTMARLCVAMRWWMIGRLVSMLAVGVITSLGMWLIGMPAPMALGALAGLLSFVPNIGPVVAAVPGLLLALGQGPWMVLGASCVYIGAQLIESNAITPLVDQYAVSVPPGLLVVTQFVFAILTGVWGMVIATPLLVVAMVLVQQLYIREGLQKPFEVTGSM